MNYNDMFYSILHEINFFNTYFYKQYLFDLDVDIVYDVRNQKQFALSSFHKENKIPFDPFSLTPIQIDSNHIMITPEKYPQYRILFKINYSLTHSKSTTSTLLSPSPTPIHPLNNLTRFLKTPSIHSSYILYFDFLTNQDLENPETKSFIFHIIVHVFQKEICYFQQFGYHQYYLLLKDIDDIQIFQYCKILKQYFQNHSKIYVFPRFLLVECHNFYHFDNILFKIKNYFQEYHQDSMLLVIKEKMDNL